MLLKSIGSEGIALYPNKNKVRDIIRRCKEIFRKSQNLSAAELISKLNPLIGGWGRYFNLDNSSKYRVSVKNALYILCWRWMYKKHPKTNKHNLAVMYFLKNSDKTRNLQLPIGSLLSNFPKKEITEGTEENLTLPSVNYPEEELLLKVNKRTWVFRGETKSENRIKDGVEYGTSYLQNPTNVSPIVSARKYQLPINLRSIHAFHKDIKKIKEFKLKISLLESAKTPTLKDKLFTNQKGLCSICERPIDFDLLHENYCHIDYINPIVKGGNKFNVKNLNITHVWCHRKHPQDL